MRVPGLALFLLACNPNDDVATDVPAESDADADTDTDTDTDTDPAPSTYDFVDRFGSDSSVSYSGQVMRHLLIHDLKDHMGGLTSRIDDGWFPVAGEVEAELDFYFSFDATTSGSVAHLFTSDPPPVQAVYDDVASGKDLVGKLAGNDPEGQHVDWTTGFVGWPTPGVDTPESLLRLWFAEIDEAAVARSNGDIPLDPAGAPLASVFVSADGLDRQQLVQKFLLGAVAFSQAADDYLDDDIAGSGLLAAHAQNEEGAPYSALEHGWDEAFGYFGAARDYAAWTDEAIADPGTSDTWSPDGAIDLTGEVCWGHAQTAAKRDLGAIAATDFTADAWAGFHGGRALLASVDRDLDDAERDALRAFRDQALGAWEAAIAATVVHYINEVIQATEAAGTPDYDFAGHAKAWSELKGFALAFQFHPGSALPDADFAALHERLGTAPALPGDDTGAYVADLLAARAIVGAAFGFDPANLGDDHGVGGW